MATKCDGESYQKFLADRAKKEPSNDRTVYVGNLKRGTDAEQVFNHFIECGQIVDISIKSHIKPYAYVEFEHAEDSRKALQLNSSELNGFKLWVMMKKADTNKAHKMDSLRTIKIMNTKKMGEWK